MSVIVLSNMGGVRPSTLPRALPDGDAQIANNLLARTSEFRPLQDDVTVATSPVGNPKTLYRMARDANGDFTGNMTLNWKTHAGVIDYVKGQVNDERTERTYYTFGDGSAPPRVMNAVGFDKPLGVPAPATAPTGQVTVNYSYTPEARTAELVKARDEAVEAILSSVVLTWLGAKFGTLDKPGNTTTGYMDIYDPTNIYNPDHAKVFRIFQVTGPNSTVVTNSFTSSVLTAQANPQPIVPGVEPILGVFDPRLGALYSQASGAYGNTTWCPLNAHVIAVPFYVYGRTYDFDLATVRNKMLAIKMPGTNGTRTLFTAAQCDTILNQIKTDFGVTGTRIAPLLARIRGVAYQFHQTLDSGSLSSIDYVINKQSELKALSEAIGAEYDKIATELPSVLEQYFYSSGVDGTVPPGKARIVEDRFYVVTYVTEWGEESAPSPVSQLAEVDENDVVTGSPPNPPAGYGITKFRYYRTNTGNTGAAFQFVDEVTFAATSLSGGALTTVTDTKKSTELGEVCPTLTWLTPPYRMDTTSSATPKPPKGANPYMRGLVGMPNGIMAGYLDNTVCFSESFVPYAWPVEYQLTTEYPVVGLGVFGQTLVVTTQGNPYYSTGSDPASMSLQKIETPQACVSARSIASSDGGVIYASPDGLCMASGQGVQLITQDHFTHEDWTKLNPSSIVGEIHEFTYYFMYDNGTQGCYALHMGTGKLTTVDVVGTAFYADMLTDRLYVVNGNTIKALFADTTYRTAKWRSKVAVLGQQAGFAWLVIESDFSAPITVRWYGDGVLVYTVVVTSRAPVRLPAGRYLEHEIEVESTARWNKLTFASSTAELQGI